MDAILIVCLAATVAADQTFSKIGPIEVFLVASILAGGLLSLRGLSSPTLRRWHAPGLIFLASIGLSAIAGVAHGIPLPQVVRAAAPYLIFGLALPFLITDQVTFDRRALLAGIIVVATFHSLYLLGLYFTANARFDVPIEVLRNRITIIDNRGMNPVFLVGAAAAISIYALYPQRRTLVLAALLAASSMIAAVSTIARAFTIASALGVLSVLFLSLLTISHPKSRRAAIAAVSALAISAAALAWLPPFSAMVDAMVLRHEMQVASGKRATKSDRSTNAQKATFERKNSTATAVGGARLTDEWPSAWRRFAEGTPVEKLIGIGAGNPFKLKDGTERTYVHNWPIYLLLYQGIFGVVAFTIFIATLGFTALRQWWVRNDVISLASLGILATMYSSATFFANHKLLSFNLLLVMVYLMVMSYRGQACR